MPPLPNAAALQALADVQARLAVVPDKEAMLAGFFAFAPFPVQVFTAGGRSLLVNQAFRDLFVAVPPPEYNVLNDEIAARSGVLDMIRAAFAGQVVQVPPIWYDPRELEQVRVEEANRVAISTICFPLFDGAGQVSHVVVIAKDETASVSARERLEEEARAKDAFLAMLSHELRGPLAPIAAALQLLRRAGGQGGRELDIIGRQVEHLAHLVDDLMDVSRITSGKIQLERQTFELARAVTRAAEIAGPLIERRQHALSLAIPAEGLVVSGDEKRLAQVFANLLTNAARYTDPGGHVSVIAAREGAWIAVTVRDDGRGIDPALLPRLFELFVQGHGHAGAGRGEGGLGLGLALVRSLVELHGGRVHASSAGPGQGSAFTVELPAADLAAGGLQDGEGGVRL